jgi:diguanylate cyclase (GGDEF)-like protein/PAS domain S-box-containing protein
MSIPEPIRLGLMPPLTGLVGLYGPEIVWAARIACDEINEQGGLLGRQLQLIVEDDGSLPATAVPAARRLVELHRCVAIIGNLLSNSRIAVANQVAEPSRVPYLNFSFYEGSISGRYFFHFAALPNQQIDQMIPYMADRFGPKMYFAGNNYEWPRGSIDAAIRSLRGLGGDVLGEDYLSIGASPDEIDALLSQVARSGADVFVPYFAGTDQIALLTRFTERGLKRRMAVVMGHYDEAMISQLKPDVREGFYSSNTYFMSIDTPENRRYLDRLALQPGIDGIWPRGNGVLTNFGEGAYLCVHAFAEAVRAAGSVESEALVNALETVRITGPQGAVQMDRNTHHAHVNTYLACCNADGTFSIVKSFGCSPPRIPERYREQAAAAQLHASPISPQAAARVAAEAADAMRRLGTARQILSLADMAILATDQDGVITDANRAACQMFGYAEDELPGLSVNMLMPPHFRLRHAEFLRTFVAGEAGELRMGQRGEVTGYRKDGSFFPLEASIAKFRNGERWVLVATLRDISERKQVEEELTRRATHDTLTGLPNRALIHERLTNALHRSRRKGLSVALLFVDLDGFKMINDTNGHEAGDALLKTVAARLADQVRPGDTVARLAGDEFVVLCEHIEQPAALAPLADRINQALRQPVEFHGRELAVTASVGVAIGHGSTHSADDLLRAADTAMYAVKEKGRDGWQFFNESLQEQAHQRLSIIQGLRTALERNEFSLRFQPIVAADSGRIVGAEALLRWHSPSGEISPAVFVPVAEATGAIVSIGLWVFRQGCSTLASWQRRWGEDCPYLSINVSARQLGEDDLAEQFSEIVRETGAEPARLLLEVTETSLMADVEANLRVLRRLTELGLRVAVDDFGTGYSSLAQLSRLPVDVLKIDRAFVEGIETREESRTVVRAVIGLGLSLGLKLVAEGVENRRQWEELRADGCDMMQGYFYYRPLHEAALVDAMTAQIGLAKPSLEAPLHYLIYVSRSTRLLSKEELVALKENSVRFNAANGITGYLVYRDGCFMQMLEGNRDTLKTLIERIGRDPRHADLRIVAEGKAWRRMFPRWGLGAQDFVHQSESFDFSGERHRVIDFMELADDPMLCYSYITSVGTSGLSCKE